MTTITQHKQITHLFPDWLINQIWFSGPGAPFYHQGLTSTLARISTRNHSKLWDEITYPYFNGTPDEVLEWISNFMSHLMMDAITYPCREFSQTILAKRGPWTGKNNRKA